MIDPENPQFNRLRPGRQPAPPPAPPPTNQTGGGLIGGGSAPRPGRQLNPRQQARADALAALTPQQIRNRQRRAAAGATPGGAAPAPGPNTQFPIQTKPLPTDSPFVQPTNPASPGPYMPGPASGQGGGWGGGASDMGAWYPSEPDNYNPATDPWKLFEQMVPVMNLNRDKQIGDAMATAGMDGNRWSTYSAGRAGQIGAETSLAQDALLGQLVNQFANNQEDRSLQGARLGLDSAALQEQMTQNRMTLPFQFGQYEQGRQDRFSQAAYDDFERNKLGWLGLLLHSADQQGAGSPGQIYTTQTPGSPGVAGYADLIRAIFGGG